MCALIRYLSTLTHLKSYLKPLSQGSETVPLPFQVVHQTVLFDALPHHHADVALLQVPF